MDLPPPPGMPLEPLILLGAMLLSGTMLLVLALYVHLHFRTKVARRFILLLVLCSFWSLLNMSIQLTQDGTQKIALQEIEYLTIIIIPVTLLTTILAYLDRSSLVNRKRLVMLLLVPALSTVMLVTNDYHHLFFATYQMTSFNGAPALRTEFGPYYIVHIVYLYSLVFLTVALLIGHLFKVEGIYRKRDILILVGIGLPFIGDMASIIGAAPSPEVSWAPVLFLAMGVTMLFALFRYHMFDLMPMARNLVWKSTPDPLFVLDERGQLVDVNDAAIERFGLSSSDIEGRSMKEIFSSDPELRGMFSQDPLSGGVSSVRGPVNRVYDIHVSTIDDKGGRPKGTLVLFRDITIHKALEEETRQSERRYRMLIENIPFPIAVVTMREGSIILVNTGMEKMLKVDNSNAQGRSIGEYIATPGGLEHLLSILGSGGVIDDYETVMADSHGGHFWSYLSARTVTLDGEPAVILAVNDITDRKTAEALKAANKKLSILSGITRHDLLNKFTAMSGYLELMENIDDKERHLQMVKKLEMSTAYAIELIRFSHDYEDLGVTAPTWQSVSAVIGRAREKLDLSGIKLTDEVRDLEIYADNMLEKVFYNLMENSIRHGERVTEIRILTEEAPDTGLRIVYSDNGAGITDEERKDLFQQGKGKNTGQGMFLTREILLLTGISISEDGESGKGVRFNITVPGNMYQRPYPSSASL